MRYILPYFGELDPTSLGAHCKQVIEYRGRNIAIHLNFGDKLADESIWGHIKDILGDIEGRDMQNRKYIEADYYNEEGETQDYLNFYLEELDEKALGTIIDISDLDTSWKILLMRKLELAGIVIQADDSDFVTFNYSLDLDGQMCNQELVILTNENGELRSIAWYS